MKRNRMFALCVTAAVATILLVPATSRAASAAIVADSYTDASYPSSNFGSKIYFKADNSPVLKAYLKFNVSGYVPGTSAALRVYAESANSVGIEVRAVADTTWQEKTITANNAPVPGPVLQSSGALKAGQWVTFDVSSVITGDGLVSFAITTRSNTSVKMTSREGVNKPQLLIPGPSSPSPFQVTRVLDSYRAESPTSGTIYSGTLKFVVESAVSDLAATGGGQVNFASGDFDLGANHFEFYGLRDIAFVGAGMGLTTIRNYTAEAGDTEPFDIVGAFGVTVRDMTVSAGGAPRTTSDALDFDNGNNSLVERVEVIASRGRGIIFDGKGAGWTSLNNVVRNCVISGVPSSGIELLASSQNTIEGNTITNVGRYGIHPNKSSTSADQPNKKSSDNVIRNNIIDQAGLDGIYVNSGDRNQITWNVVTNSSDDATSRDGIRIGVADSQTANDNVVANNVSTDNQTVKTQRYGLNIASSLCNRTVVGLGNDFTGNLVRAINNLGTGTIYY